MQRPGGFDPGLQTWEVLLSEHDTEAAVLMKIDGVACELRKVLKEFEAIGGEWQQVLVGREIRRLAGRKRGRPPGDRPAVQQHNRLMSCRCELKGGASPQDPTANNDDLRLARNHTTPLRCHIEICPQESGPSCGPTRTTEQRSLNGSSSLAVADTNSDCVTHPCQRGLQVLPTP